ncbi:MAG: hypothetical protein ACQKBU_07325, partial [Verrucomicrobiales bacterium]
PEELRDQWLTIQNEQFLVDASLDDYPRAELTQESVDRLDLWVTDWVRQHRHLVYHETGRDCQALARALAGDLLIYPEIANNEAQIITGTVSGRGHEITVVRGPGRWIAYDPQIGRLSKMWPPFRGMMF